MSLWNHETVRAATGGEVTGQWQATRVVIDSRNVQPGDVFVALRGEHFDGHAFVTAAKNRGAVAAMVDHVPADVAPNFPLIIVEDTLEGLRQLAMAARERFTGNIIAVTGSVGKTSAKEMLRTAFSALGEAYATSGNFNNHIGMPLTLANLPITSHTAILEMGMNHAGEITPLTTLAKPHAVLITNVEAVHLEFFSGIEGIADAKSEIFNGLGQEGVAILPADSAQLPRLKQNAEKAGVAHVLTFGEQASADFRLLDVTIDRMGTSVEAQIIHTPMSYKVGTYGRHWAVMSLAVLGVVEALGEDLAKAAQALARFRELPGRGAVRPLVIDGKEILLVDDSYNASPVSMQQGLRNLHDLHRLIGGKGRTVAVLGDMLELGEETHALHVSLAGPVREWGIDTVYCAGPRMKHLYDSLPSATQGGWWEKADDMRDSLIASIKSGDTLMVKGSHGSYVYTIAEHILALGQAAGKKERTDAL